MTRVNLTPTWSALLPVWLRIFEDAGEDGKAAAREELARMAKAADAWNKHCRESKR